MNIENGRHNPLHVAAILCDGTAKGELEKVVYGVGLHRGQALAGDWPRGGQILAIKGAEGFDNFGIKLAMFLDVFERFDKGLLILASRGGILELLGRFSLSFEPVSKLTGNAR